MTPDEVDALTVEDFYILTAWLENHENKNKNAEDENEE